MNTLEFDSVHLEFGMHRVLSSVYISCTTGQIVGILGRNGSGKSCLLQIVFGTMNAQFKSIRLNKLALSGNYLVKEVIAYLPQIDLLPSFLSFRKAIELYGADQGKIVNHFPELKECLNRMSSEVSGGQRRLFEVLLILYSKHPFCLLDEPFSGLAPVHIDRLKEIFKTEKQNKGIIITDHLHRHIRDAADQLYVLVNGKTYPVSDEQQLITRGYLNEL